MGIKSTEKEQNGIKHITKGMSALTEEAVSMPGCSDAFFKKALKNVMQRAEYMIKDTFRMQKGEMPKRVNLKAGNKRNISIRFPVLTGTVNGGLMDWEWSKEKLRVEQGSFKAHDVLFEVISSAGIFHNGMLREVANMLHHDLAYSTIKGCRKAVIGGLISRGRADGLILMSKKLTGNLYLYRLEDKEEVKKKLLSLGNKDNRLFILKASLKTARTYYSGFLPQNEELFHELVGEALVESVK